MTGETESYTNSLDQILNVGGKNRKEDRTYRGSDLIVMNCLVLVRGGGVIKRRQLERALVILE